MYLEGFAVGPAVRWWSIKCVRVEVAERPSKSTEIAGRFDIGDEMAGFATKFESRKQEWTTPQDMWDQLNSEFHFSIDLAADGENTKCTSYYSKESDALRQEWNGVGWLNPPYGDGISKLSKWVQKAFDETRKPGCTVVMLIPARTNTRWWHQYCMQAAEIRFINGRPKFGNAAHGLPQPLALIVFRNDGEALKVLSYDVPTAGKKRGAETSFALAV